MDIKQKILSNQLYSIAGVLAAMLVVGAVAGTFGLTNSPDNANYHRQSTTTADTSLAFSGSSGLERNSGGMTAETSNIRIVASNVEASMIQIERLVEDFNGSIEHSSVNKDTQTSAYLRLKVPDDRREDFITRLEEYGKIESKSMDSTDLEETYTQQRLELENKRQELDRLEELINQTEEVEDLIKIQERMSELRSRIQYLENSLENIEERTSMTAISIQIEQRETFVSEFDLVEAFTSAYKGFFNSIRLIIVGAGYVLPLLLIGAGLIGIRRLLERA